jgi:hypothetical protein
MQIPASEGDGASALAMDLAIIRGSFAAALREKGYQPSTIGVCLAVLCRAARLLGREGGSLAEL